MRLRGSLPDRYAEDFLCRTFRFYPKRVPRRAVARDRALRQGEARARGTSTTRRHSRGARGRNVGKWLVTVLCTNTTRASSLVYFYRIFGLCDLGSTTRGERQH